MNRDTQRLGDPQQATEAGVTARSFQVGDVRARQLASIGEHLLSPEVAFSSALYVGGEAAPDFIFRFDFHLGSQIRLNQRSVYHKRQGARLLFRNWGSRP